MPDTDPLIGQTVADRWQVTRLVSIGTSANIYAAKDTSNHTRVALKVLHPHLAEQPEMLRRFEREFDTVRSLTHRNLAAPIDRGQIPDGPPWFTMELVEGRTLEALLIDGPLPPHRALSIVAQVAEALAHAHAHGIVHRDVCPSNVVVGRGDQVKLIDFGLALQDSAERITLAGLRIGSPLWMSPETARGEAVGPPADVYGLGCLLFAAVCGRAPFVGSSMKVLEAHASSPPPPLVVHVAGLPAWLDEMLASLLAKKPEDRPPADRVARVLSATAIDLEASEARPSLDAPTNPRDSYPVGVTQGHDVRLAEDPQRLLPMRSGAVAFAASGATLAALAVALIAGVWWSVS